MSHKKLYSIHDKTAAMFCPPFSCVNDAQATRAFQSNMQNPDSNIARFPADYNLYYVGEFNELTGELEFEEPTRIITGLEMLKTIKAEQPDLLEANETES